MKSSKKQRKKRARKRKPKGEKVSEGYIAMNEVIFDGMFNVIEKLTQKKRLPSSQERETSSPPLPEQEKPKIPKWAGY